MRLCISNIKIIIGRGDAGANIFDIVADRGDYQAGEKGVSFRKTGYKLDYKVYRLT